MTPDGIFDTTIHYRDELQGSITGLLLTEVNFIPVGRFEWRYRYLYRVFRLALFKVKHIPKLRPRSCFLVNSHPLRCLPILWEVWYWNNKTNEHNFILYIFSYDYIHPMFTQNSSRFFYSTNPFMIVNTLKSYFLSRVNLETVTLCKARWIKQKI